MKREITVSREGNMVKIDCSDEKNAKKLEKWLGKALRKVEKRN